MAVETSSAVPILQARPKTFSPSAATRLHVPPPQAPHGAPRSEAAPNGGRCRPRNWPVQREAASRSSAASAASYFTAALISLAIAP